MQKFEQYLALIQAAYPRKNQSAQRFWAGCLRSAVEEQGKEPSKWIAELKSTQAKTATEERILRFALRDKFGSRNYKITVSDEVHVYGPMPNARHLEGWYLLGDKNSVLRDIENDSF